MHKVVVAVLLALVGVLVAVVPAAACSCAEATLDDLLAREPEAAAALVRRVDDASAPDGRGTVRVVGELVGELPDLVDVRFDTGASCMPMLAPHQLATLSFRPEGDGWAAIECGILDSADALGRLYGPLAPDPDATGPPALVVTGRFPGAGVVALDRELRVLGVAAADGVERAVPCADGVVTIRRDDLTAVVERRSLPALDVTATVRLQRPGGWYPVAAGCDDDGRLRTIATEDLPAGGTVIHRDLLGAPADVIEAPHALAGAFLDGEAWLLAEGQDGRSTRLEVVDLGSGGTTTRRTFPGLSVHELRPSPDGAHAALVGYAERSVVLVLDTATATPVAELAGDWYPVGDGWTGPDRLAFADQSGGIGAEQHVRLTDGRLRPVGELTVPYGWPIGAAGDAVLIGGGSELSVLRADGSVHPSPDLRLSVADRAVALGEVTGPDRAATLGGGSTDASGGSPEVAATPAWQLAAATVATVAVVGALVVLRRRRAGAVDGA